MKTAIVSLLALTGVIVAGRFLPINVDVDRAVASPLSTFGAWRMVQAAAGVDRKRLFKQMLAWGLSLCPVGALVC